LENHFMTTHHFEEVVCLSTPARPEDVVSDAYWRVNLDARVTGLTAQEHYRLHGQSEGRRQAANMSEVARIRDEKLKRVKFRKRAPHARESGKAASYLTEQLVREFRIPEFPPISAHDYGGFIAKMQREHPDWMFLDVGAGLRGTVSSNMVNVDIFDAVSTDVVCVGEELPFADNQFDYIICSATLEHTRRPWDVAREICRVLKPGGTVRVDYSFLQPVHDYPAHYFNATPEGNISLFEKSCDIKNIAVPDHFHPVWTLRWILRVWRDSLPEADRKVFSEMTVGQLMDTDEADMLKQGFCLNLADAARLVIGAGSSLEAVKKTDPVELLPFPRKAGVKARRILADATRPMRKSWAGQIVRNALRPVLDVCRRNR
jgi:SAM-dependent methyltransferase